MPNRLIQAARAIDYQLHLGDSREVMRALPSNRIDLTVTSPPYDDLRTYEGSLEWGWETFTAIADELWRVTSDGGVVVWNVNDATIKGSETGTSFRQALYFKELGFNLHDTMIWEKAGTGACGSNLAYWQSFEFMFVLSKGRPKTINRLADRDNKRAGAVCTKGRITADGREKDAKVRVVPERSVRTNVWRYQVGNNGDDAVSHPAKFPEALARDHIVSWSAPGAVVFDPFLGSGTTGKMAILEGRKFIGIEKVPKYYEIAEARISEAYAAMQAAELDRLCNL